MAPRVFIAGSDRETVYVATRMAIWCLNGDSFVEVPFAAMAIEGIAVHDGDLLVVGREASTLRVRRRHGEAWSDERSPATSEAVSFSLLAAQAAVAACGGVSLRALTGGIVGRAAFATSRCQVFVPRDAAWRRARRRHLRERGVPSRRGSWRSLGSLDGVPAFLVTRSPAELYAGMATKGLLRFDGSRWIPTSYGGAIAAVAATSVEALVLRQTE